MEKILQGGRKMKKIKLLLVAAAVAGLVTGCGRSSFEPDQTGISVNKNGSIVSVIKESLDKNYYNQTELETMIHDTVDLYNTNTGEERVEIDEYQVENGVATLKMTYDSGQDYRDLNQVRFFQGDLAGIQGTEYQVQGTFFEIDNGTVTGKTVDASGVLSGSNHNIIVLEEEILVQVPGDILYVSSNVEVIGDKEAKAGGEFTQTTEDQIETDVSGIPVINPEEVEETESQIQGSHELFYIIYE